MLKIHCFVSHPFNTNSYLLQCQDQRAVVIDPAGDCEPMLAWLMDHATIPVAVLLTHGHFDHFDGLPQLLSQFPELPIFIGEEDISWLRDPDRNLSRSMATPLRFDGQVTAITEDHLHLAGCNIAVRLMPGHSPGGRAFIVDNCCFCGDTLFAGCVGRSDLPGGSEQQLMESISGQILTLSDETILYTGHGKSTSVGEERWGNMALRWLSPE